MSDNGYVTPESLRSAATRRFADYTVDGLGTVRVRSLTESEDSKIQAAGIDSNGEARIEMLPMVRATRIANCLVGPDDKRLEISPTEVLEWDSGIVDVLDDICLQHLRGPSYEEVKKNSEPTTASCS